MEKDDCSGLEQFDSAGRGRRRFIERGFSLAFALGGTGILSACGTEGDEEQKVSPSEDLMQEHGILNRVLLVYDRFLELIKVGKDIDPGLVQKAAKIIREFIEDYHEKQEEQYLFPRFEKAGELVDLVRTLRVQHQQGGIITSNILHLAKRPGFSDEESQELYALLSSFIMMYRPHEAREDTVLFPAFRSLVGRHEYDSLGEEFEKNEHRMFGEGGFQEIVNRVSEIEKKLGIFELDQFTPKQL